MRVTNLRVEITGLEFAITATTTAKLNFAPSVLMAEHFPTSAAHGGG
jgi:hypothetical protein